uniref:Trigger factor n=1 Tax=uncultured bacterium contig00007 TaxID=1181499 RepID=A0A806KSB8_9BACT|nr:cell division trigger factor [uncultured bacterium contig00007]
MAVTKELTRLDKSNVKLSITVPKDEVRAKYQGMLKEYSKSLQLPGFRKGHVPQEVLERKFAEALRGEAMGRIIEDALQDYFKDEKLPRNERPLPYATPELQEEPKFDLESDLQFSVVYDVLPEIKVDKWKGLTIEYPYAEVGKEEIDKELQDIRDRNSVVMDKDESAKVAKGDVVTVDYSILDENGEEQPNLSRKDFAFTLGSGTNFYQFDDDIIGMKKGETKEINKKFANDFFEASLAGQTRKIKVSLTSLKEKKLPDLDDDLAQDVDEKFKTLDDLKNSIKERLEKNLEWRLRDKKVNELLKNIMESTPVVLPESMVRAEVESRVRKLARYYNTDPNMLMQMMATGEGHEEREKEWRETAVKALHSRLIIETLMEEQNIEVTDADLEQELEKIAKENNVEIEEVRKNYDEQNMFYLKEDIRERRLIDIMLAENTLKQGKKENYLDFMTDKV